MESKNEDSEYPRLENNEKCSKLTYLENNQIHIKRIRRRNQSRTGSTKEIGIVTNFGEFDVKESETSTEPIITVSQSTTTIEAYLNGFELDTDTTESEPFETALNFESSDPKSDLDNNHISPLTDDLDLDTTKSKSTQFDLKSPVFIAKNDIHDLLQIARERGLTKTPKWQRQGITRINQFLIHLEPFRMCLAEIYSILRSKVTNTEGGQERLIFFHFWFIGLTIGYLRPAYPTEVDYLIQQFYIPMRRIFKLTTQIKSFLIPSMKKFHKRSQTLINEMDKQVYNDLLRMTTLNIPNNDGITNEDEPLTSGFQVVPTADESNQSNLVITSVSTVLLISSGKSKNTGEVKKLSSLSTLEKTYVIQGILSTTQEMISKMAENGRTLDKLFRTIPASLLKQSTKALLKELKTMRKKNGLRHINASRNFSNSFKKLEYEILFMGQMFQAVENGVNWIQQALEQCLHQIQRWSPQEPPITLRSPKSPGIFNNCFRTTSYDDNNLEKQKTFKEFFGTDDFKEITSAFQIRVSIMKNRHKVLFPSLTSLLSPSASDSNEDIPTAPSPFEYLPEKTLDLDLEQEFGFLVPENNSIHEDPDPSNE